MNPEDSKKKKIIPFNSEKSALYQQLILNRNVQVFLQLEQFSKQQPIILSRKQYDKVKKTIQKTVTTKRSVHDKRKPLYSKRALSEVSVGEVRTRRVKDQGIMSYSGKAKKQFGHTLTATTQGPHCEIEAQTDDLPNSRVICKHFNIIGECGRYRQPAFIDNWRFNSPDQNHDRGDAKFYKTMKDKNNEVRNDVTEIKKNNSHRIEIVTERSVGVGGARVDHVGVLEHVGLASIEECFDKCSKKVQTPEMKCRERIEEVLQKEAEVETYVLFNAEKTRDVPKDTIVAKCDDAKKTMSSVEIRYASVALMKQVAYSSTNVGALSDSSLGHLNSFHTIFRGRRKCATPNLGTSAYSLYSDDAYKYNIENKGAQMETRDSKPKKPFLRRLMSCLVMRSTRNSVLKIPGTPQHDLPSVNSSIDSYHISTSLGAMEISSSLYDTSASFYSNHTILPINAKIKRGFFSSVRGFLTNRKS